jgi:hypothetical protein
MWRARPALAWRVAASVGSLVGRVAVRLAPVAGLLAASATPVRAAGFLPGDILVGLNNGTVRHYNPDGTLVQTLDTTLGGYMTGMAFDAAGNLYVTKFFWQHGHQVRQYWCARRHLWQWVQPPSRVHRD